MWMTKSWATKYWKQMNRDRFGNPATSDIQIHILQPRTIFAKSFMSYVAEFVDPPLTRAQLTT